MYKTIGQRKLWNFPHPYLCGVCPDSESNRLNYFQREKQHFYYSTFQYINCPNIGFFLKVFNLPSEQISVKEQMETLMQFNESIKMPFLNNQEVRNKIWKGNIYVCVYVCGCL